MFNLHDFVLSTIKKMVGNEQDFKVMQYALTYYNRDILKDEDMQEIQNLIDAQYVEKENEVVPEEV